ncbi:DUF3489 domain-containing protein [Qipengyuania sp. DSG2-2]|uniref:DUF3489 domain-containing protein n=1 Tax=Qipengyuania sp. DGS2-2 TaxID=3349631 RepID=UPI0036D2FED2
MTRTAKNNAPAKTTKPKRKTKASIVEALLERKDGSSLADICKATGWQTHSSRAFLTGLRKKGREVVRYKNDKGASIYKLTTLDTGEGGA